MSGEARILSVSGITALVKDAVEGEPVLQEVWVEGEVSNFKRHGSGHLYFSLKDEGAQIRAVMFRQFAPSAGAGGIGDGAKVHAFGSVGVYEKRGEYQLYVRRLRPAGLGELYVRFEELKKKLAAEGLFDEGRKKALPEFPWKVAVVTSPTGAAVRDVINVITRRFPPIELVVVPAVVQGEEAPGSIAAALGAAQGVSGVSLILLVRGGGSIEDLWGFNDERVARAIAASRVPVVTGVGHETDFTIADFAADLRAPTPSAAAEIAVPSLEEVLGKVARAGAAILRAASGRVALEKAKLEGSRAVLTTRRVADMVRQKQQYVDERVAAAAGEVRYRLEAASGGVRMLHEKLKSLDPMRVLSRGYSLCYDSATGDLVRSVSQVRRGRRLRTRVADGEFFSVAEGRGGGEKGMRDRTLSNRELDLRGGGAEG
ncbi:MAG: exodeoxyribonuclease VII large subunit [bacterium]